MPKKKKKLLNEKLDNFAESIEQNFFSLYYRWQDEKKYENINEYGLMLSKHLPKGWSYLSMDPEPFGFNFLLEKKVFSICYFGGEFGWYEP